MVIRDQRTLARGVNLPVMPDPGRHGQQLARHPGHHPLQRASPMAFQTQLPLESVEDRLDPLADPAEVPEPRFLILPVRSQQMRLEVLGDERFELLAREALVRQDDLPVTDQVATGIEHRGDRFTLADLRVGQPPDDRHAIGGGDQI